MPKAKGKSKKKSKAVTAEDLKKQEEQRILNEKRMELYESVLERNHEEALLNEYQLHKERLTKFWDISKKQRKQLNRELRSRNRRSLNLEEKHRFEMKIYKEKIKHLLHQQLSLMVDDQIEAQQQIKIEQTEHRDANRIENKNTSMVKVVKKRTEFNVYEFLNRLRLEHQKKVMALREEFEFKQNNLIMHNRQTMERLRKEKEDAIEKEIEKIAAFKDKDVERLIKDHKIAFEDIKGYYRDVTLLNLELIKSHKDQVGEMKKIEQELAKEVQAVTYANKKLSLPLRTNIKLSSKLKQDLELYKKEKLLLKESLENVHVLEEKIKSKKWEKEVLVQKMTATEQKKEKAERKLAVAIQDVQQKVGFNNLLLEKKLETINQDLETTHAALREIINSSNLPPEVIGNLNTIEDVTAKKQREIEEEQDKSVKLRKCYYDTIQAYETILKKYDIPIEELGFMPGAI